jgi:hypothetical protein
MLSFLTRKEGTEGNHERMSSLSGWLWKMKKDTKILVPQYVKRWFSIEGKVLRYYDSAHSEHASGYVDLATVELIRSMESSIGTYVFIVNHPDRKLVLRAVSAAERSKWVRALNQQADLARGGCGMGFVCEQRRLDYEAMDVTPTSSAKKSRKGMSLEDELEDALSKLEELEMEVQVRQGHFPGDRREEFMIRSEARMSEAKMEVRNPRYGSFYDFDGDEYNDQKPEGEGVHMLGRVPSSSARSNGSGSNRADRRHPTGSAGSHSESRGPSERKTSASAEGAGINTKNIQQNTSTQAQDVEPGSSRSRQDSARASSSKKFSDRLMGRSNSGSVTMVDIVDMIDMVEDAELDQEYMASVRRKTSARSGKLSARGSRKASVDSPCIQKVVNASTDTGRGRGVAEEKLQSRHSIETEVGGGGYSNYDNRTPQSGGSGNSGASSSKWSVASSARGRGRSGSSSDKLRDSAVAELGGNGYAAGSGKDLATGSGKSSARGSGSGRHNMTVLSPSAAKGAWDNQAS